MATSRSTAGGKLVEYRRKQRIAATPYERPQPSKSPNWFAGVVVPSAIAIASGAGKILSSIFSDSSSSEEYDSEDDIVNDDLHEIPYNRECSLKENVTSSEMMGYKTESQFSVWRSITKKIIELLIMKETFSREECNMLIEILNSRVMDWSMDAGDNSFVSASHGEKLHHDVDIFYKAVQEAKRWFQDKKAGLSSVTELAQGTSNLNSEMVEHVETGGGSPVEVARSYMKAMQSWTSSGVNIEMKTPLRVSMKLFQEGMPYSAGHYSSSSSSSKNRRSFASGLWDIQEELRIVRSRETKDMLRSPSTETDPSHAAVAQIRMRSPVAGEELLAMGERITEPLSSRLHNPIEACVHSGVSSLADVRRWHEESDKENNNEDRGTTEKLERELKQLQTSVNYNARGKRMKWNIWHRDVIVVNYLDAAQIGYRCYFRERKFFYSLKASPSLNIFFSDLQFSKVNCFLLTEVAEFGGRRECSNDPSSSQVSLSRGVAKHDADDALMDVSIVSETNSMTSGSRNNFGVNYEERSLDIDVTSHMQKQGIAGGKQQGRKKSVYSRKGKGGRDK